MEAISRQGGRVLVFFAAFFLASCALAKKEETGPPLGTIIEHPLSPEETNALLKEVGENWLYGEGVGDTALTAGTVALFPPYAFWVVSNALLALSGYETVNFAEFLPENKAQSWRETYASIASGPGRFAAALAGKEYRSPEIAKARLEKYLARVRAKSKEQNQAPAREQVSSERQGEE